MKVSSPQRRPRAEQGGSRTVLLWVGICIAVMVIGVILRPLYWTIHAEVIHPFRSQGASSDAAALPQDADTASPATVSKAIAAEATAASSSAAQAAANQAGEATPAEQDPATSAGQDSVGVAGSVGAEPATAAAEAGSSAEFREEDYQLTSERMRAMADEKGYIVVTFGNFHYMDFILNWVYHVEAVGVKNYAVGAMDVEALRALAEKGLNTFSMSSGLTTGDFGWGTPTFHRMGRHKINLIRNMVQLGLHVVFCDVDTVWVRNPMPYMMQYPDADILTSSDHLVNTVDDEGLEKWPQAGSAANIGIMLFRPTTLEFLQEWSKVLEEDEKVWDQNAFNTLFRRGSSPLPDDPQRLFAAYDGKLKMGILPVALFCSGHTFFVQKMHQKLGFDKPYVVHATFQYSGTPGKRNRFREQLLWSDGLDYFDHPVGFLSFDLDLPADLLAAAHPLDPPTRGLDNTWGHFNLTMHQLPQVRQALAVAQALGRVLVFPRLWCGLDRWWAPHLGTIPSAGGPTLPFQCPLDHLLNLEKLANPSLNLGPHIDWRESSFLDNPRLPASVSSSRVSVHVCQEGEEGCVDGSASAAVPGDGQLRLAPNLTDRQLKTALAPLGGRVKILHFAEMLRVFKGHESTQDSNDFKKRTDEYTSLWCCVDAHPGHVHYDMWPHLVPHTDRFQREWTTLWYPTTGP